jgi:ribonucleoside-diphosphate reductase alpha chain
MITHLSLEQDLALKRYVSSPEDSRPRYNWSVVLGEHGIEDRELSIRYTDTEQKFSLEEVATTVGNALAALLHARNETEVFTDKNKAFVARITREVVEQLRGRLNGQNGGSLSSLDLDLEIERILVHHNAHDVAKSLIFSRAQDVRTSVAPLQTRLIRRNNMVVPWNESKIEIAIRKAFLSMQRDSSPAVDVAHAVTERVRSLQQAFIHIEEVQDIVQEELMRAGHFKVAEQYILYRARRSLQRGQTEEEVPQLDPQQNSMVVVRLSDQESIFWDGQDLKKRIEFASLDLDLNMTTEEIERELRRSVYEEMSLEDLKKTIVLNAKAMLERDADFALFAGRILLTFIYEEVLDWDILRDGISGLKHAHQVAFVKNMQRAIEIERINPKLAKKYNLQKLAAALDPSSDLNFDYLGIQTLYDRYLIVDKTGPVHRRLETPQLFWMRVAMGLFLLDEENAEERVIELYKLYRTRRFCSSTPTLFNSGTLHSQLSSCYLYYVDDSIEGIMQRGIADNAYLSKWAGGLGGSWTAVRGTGGHIKGTNGESQGVIPFLKLHNDQLIAVNQGGKRRGSGCAYLETWHNDLFDFLELRRNVGDDRRRTHDMNTANWIPDLFMKRMEARQEWTFFRSNEVPDLHEIYGEEFEKRYEEYEAKAKAGEIYGKSVPAIDVWKKMLQMLAETGHPWITFKDPCNIRNPQDHVGVIHSSNLCTEITLNTSKEETAVCNLGSVILESHLDAHGKIDHEKLRETIRVAVRALDNVIDLNFYPTEAARVSNTRNRPIGLGVMGLQNALYQKGISFASNDAVEFNDEFMEAIAYYAYEASSDLAEEKGTYPTFKGSKWSRGLLPQDSLVMLEKSRKEELPYSKEGKMDWKPLREKIARQGMRNSNVIAIAPTATISNIMRTSPCIEPAYKNLFVKSNLAGDFICLNSYLVKDLKKEGLWDKDMLDSLKYFDGELEHIDRISAEIKHRYRTAFSVPSTFLIQAAARRQKWIDQSQSVNLFLGTPDMKELSHMYREAWHAGLKTTYYLRTLGASNIEQATLDVKKEVRIRPTEEEKRACSIEAMKNGEICEACQ